MNRIVKSLGVLLIAASVPATLAAQSFNSGDNVIGIGAGVGGMYGFGPVVMLNFDHGMGFNAGPGVVGIGAYLSYKSYENAWSNYYYNYTYRSTALTIAARGTYHWNSWHKIDKLDVYGGVIAGFSIRTYGNNIYEPDARRNGVSPTGGLFVGAHWYFTDSFGAFAELGYTDTNIAAGLAFKF